MGDLRFYAFFNSVSVISGWWEVDNERLCAMELCLWLTRFHLKWGSRGLFRISQGPKTGPIPNFFKIMQNSQILQLTPAIFIPKCPVSFPIFAKKGPFPKDLDKALGSNSVWLISRPALNQLSYGAPLGSWPIIEKFFRNARTKGNSLWLELNPRPFAPKCS